MTESASIEHTHDTHVIYDIAEISRYFNNENVDAHSVDRHVVYYEVDNTLTTTDVPVRIIGLTIGICTEGEGELCVGVKRHKFRKNSLMMLNPNQYVRSIQTHHKVRMRVIGCNLETIELIMPKLSGLLPVIIHNPLESVSDLSEEQASGIQEYFDLIQGRLSRKATPFSKSKINSLLQALLYEIMEYHFVETDGTEKPRSRKEEILAKFIIEVLQHFRSERSVAFYADRLCMTPKHLSAVVKEITQHTASELIDHYVVMEAKIMLKETDLTIQEIAARLNFANQSFFGKYFKHLTGFSPTNYRKETLN